MYYYDAQTNGFYTPEIHGDAIPGTAVEISDELYAELMGAQMEGKMITAAADGLPITVVPEPPVPQRISRFQARAALMGAGLLDQVEQAVASSSDPLVKLAWTEAVEFPRTSPTIAALAAELGLTDEQLDDLFRKGAEIAA